MDILINDYPEDPSSSEDETYITLNLEVNTSNYFPRDWDVDHIKDYIRENIRDFLDGDIDIQDIVVWQNES